MPDLGAFTDRPQHGRDMRIIAAADNDGDRVLHGAKAANKVATSLFGSSVSIVGGDPGDGRRWTADLDERRGNRRCVVVDRFG